MSYLVCQKSHFLDNKLSPTLIKEGIWGPFNKGDLGGFTLRNL